MTALGRVLTMFILLALTGCGGPYGSDEDDGWRALRAESPIFSTGGTFGRPMPRAGYGSGLTVPRVTGAAPAPARLGEEDGNVWPDPEAHRATLIDPEAVVRGIPPFRPQASRPQPAPYDAPPPGAADPAAVPLQRPRQGAATLPGGRLGEIMRRPDGLPAVTGAGTEGVWTYEAPGRPGVGTALPDGRGGRVLVEPGGRTVIAPR